MARVTCRCGEVLEAVGVGDGDRIVCPRCGARIRVHRRSRADQPPPPNDGLVRFACPCGRRLKVRAADHPRAGRCPDCGRTVPVPTSTADGALDDPEARTEELDQTDVARLQRWAARHGVLPRGGSTSTAPPSSSVGETSPPPPSSNRAAAPKPYAPPKDARVEAGMRVCPKCGQPLHMSAIACPSCGAYAPKR